MSEGESLLQAAESKGSGQPPLIAIEAGAPESKPQALGLFGRLKFLMWLFCVCFSLAGVQFVYSIQFALGIYFIEQL